MAASLVQLLSATGVVLKTRWMSLLAGVAVAGFLLFTLRALYIVRLETFRTSVIQGISMDRQSRRLADLQRRREAGDTAAALELKQRNQELAKRLDQARSSPLRAASAGFELSAFATIMGPLLLLFVIGGAMIQLLVLSYIILQQLHVQEPLETARRAVQLLPSVGLLIGGMSVFSFLWVPLTAVIAVRMLQLRPTDLLAVIQLGGIFLGYFCALILTPRYLLAPLLLIRDQLGIADSLRISFDRTSGYWGKILGHSLLMIGLLGAIHLILSAVLHNLLFFMPALPLVFLRTILFEMEFVVFTIFSTHLAVTVFDHPFAKEDVVDVGQATVVA